MAKRRTRTRGRLGRRDASEFKTTRRARTAAGAAEASVVPRILVGAVEGVGAVAVGAFQLTRDVLLNAASGAANIGAEALTVAVAAARGVVSAASRMAGDIAGSVQGMFREALDSARSTEARRSRGRGRRQRPAARQARASLAS